MRAEGGRSEGEVAGSERRAPARPAPPALDAPAGSRDGSKSSASSLAVGKMPSAAKNVPMLDAFANVVPSLSIKRHAAAISNARGSIMGPSSSGGGAS